MKSGRPDMVAGGDSMPHASVLPTSVDDVQAHLAAIVEWSDDAILTKDLDGIIKTWNRGAQRIFGYTADETIGRSVTMLIPEDRHDEEPEILAKIRRGEPVSHYETIRRRKDGELIHISLTVSPMRDERGTIIGASKIARDITERHRAEEAQRLLLGEMQHRIKNVFALVSGLVGLCAMRATTPQELASMVRSRLVALSEAHALTVPSGELAEAGGAAGTTLRELLRVLVAPTLGEDQDQVVFHGQDLLLSPQVVTPMALVMNELVTNAAKHGALSEGSGRVICECTERAGWIVVDWSEHIPAGGLTPPEHEGFGTHLSRLTVERQLGGQIERTWRADGLSVRLTIDPARLEARC